MALPTFATLDDLEARVDVDDTSQAEAVIANVSATIRAVTGRSFLDEGDPPAVIDNAAMAEVLRIVDVEAAARVVQNPDGVTTDTLGPDTKTYADPGPARIFLTKLEREMLDQAVALAYPAKPVAGLGVIRTTRGHIETRSVDIADPDERCHR